MLYIYYVRKWEWFPVSSKYRLGGKWCQREDGDAGVEYTEGDGLCSHSLSFTQMITSPIISYCFRHNITL